MLKPEASLTIGLATGAIVYGTFQTMLPRVADTRTVAENNGDIAAAEKSATWTSAAIVAGISLIAKDPTVFIIGGAITVAMAWFYKHGNAVVPEFGMAVPKGDNLPEQFDESQMAAAENYANEEMMSY